MPVSLEAKEKIDKELAYWEVAARKRKKIRDEVWALIKDALPENLNAQAIKVRILFQGAAFYLL